MSYEKGSCYRNPCIAKCDDQGTQLGEIARLQHVLTNLRRKATEKEHVLADIAQLENAFGLILAEKETVVNEYTIKLDIDSDTLNKLQLQIQEIKRRQVPEGMQKQIQGLEKAIELKSAELRRLVAEAQDSDHINENIFFENRDLQINVGLLKDQIFSLGKDEDGLGRGLADNFSELRIVDRHIIDCQAEVCKKTKAIKVLEDQVKALSGRGKKDEGQVRKLEAELNDLSMRIDDQRNRVATLESMCEGISSELRNTNFQIEHERQEYQDTEQQWLELQEAIRDREKKIQDAMIDDQPAKLAKLRADIERLKCEAEKTAVVIGEFQGVGRGLVSEIDLMLKQNQSIQASLERKLAVGQDGFYTLAGRGLSA